MIEKLLNIEREQASVTDKYFILGHFGDRLPEDVQKELRLMAEQQQQVVNKRRSKFKNSL